MKEEAQVLTELNEGLIMDLEKTKDLIKELFELLDRTEESDSGSLFRPVHISCSREQDRLHLNKILVQLKNTLEESD